MMFEQVEKRIQKVVSTYPTLKSMMTMEPGILGLMQLAASQEVRSDRWEMYEILKQASQYFVGWKASNPALRNENSYGLMLSALDLLLPPPEIEGKTIEDWTREYALKQLRDAVIQAFPQVQLPPVRNEEGKNDYHTH